MTSPKILTSRELEVLRLVRLRTKEIAARLHISVGTASNHLHNIYEKIGVRSKAEATHYVDTHDIPPEK